MLMSIKMNIRRYYPKDFKGKTYSDEYLLELEQRGVNTELIDNAQVEIKFTRNEQEAQFQQNVDMIMNNTRWVLDNLDSLKEYKVNWENYKKNRKVYK